MTKSATPAESKESILSAFNRIIGQRKIVGAKIATKEQEAEQAKNKEMVATASTYTVDNIVKGLADLQLEFGGTISNLAEKLTQETNKLEEIKRAIQFETTHLEELQQIRVVADALYILQQEHQEYLKSLEQKAVKEREKIEKEKNSYRKAWQKEQQEYEAVVQEQNQLLERDRQQELEDYQYNNDRSRKIETDEYQSSKRKVELSLQDTNQDKEKVWTERERILSLREPEFRQHEEKITAFPSELEAAVKKAREEAIKEASDDAKFKANLFEKEWEATKQGYEMKIQSLEATIGKQDEQITELSTQLQAAVSQARELAIKAFNNSSSSK